MNSGQRKILFHVWLSITAEKGSLQPCFHLLSWSLGTGRRELHLKALRSLNEKPLAPCHFRACISNLTDSWTPFQGYGMRMKALRVALVSSQNQTNEPHSNCLYPRTAWQFLAQTVQRLLRAFEQLLGWAGRRRQKPGFFLEPPSPSL